MKKKYNKKNEAFADQFASAMVDNLNRNVAREQSMLDPFRDGYWRKTWYTGSVVL